MNLTIRQRCKRFWFSWPKNCILLAVVKEMAENKKFEQMSKEEKDKLAHGIVKGQLLFAKTIGSAFGDGTLKNEEIEKFIMEKSLKELENYVEKKVIYKRL